MAFVEPVVLQGTHARLEPLAVAHEAELRSAAQDGRLWELWYTSVPHPDKTSAYIQAALDWRDRGGAMPFVVRALDSGQVVGSTRYCNIEAAHRRLEIGYTWYAKRAQRTAVNTECKLLLLTHAFETLNCIAVEFRTHFINTQSRKAIERLGAKLDGVLRSHQIMPDGTLRDTCVYSILAHEWPAVRQHLRFQLDRPRSAD